MIDFWSRRLPLLAAAPDSGALSEREFSNALRNQLQFGPETLPDAMVSALFRHLDADSSRDLSLPELVAFLEARHAPCHNMPRSVIACHGVP